MTSITEQLGVPDQLVVPDQLFQTLIDTTYDEKDDESYVASESETEVSLASDYDMTEEFDKLTFVNLADTTKETLLEENTNGVVLAEKIASVIVADDISSEVKESISVEEFISVKESISDGKKSISDVEESVSDANGAIDSESNSKEAPTGVIQFLIKHEIPRKIFHSLHGFITVGLYVLGWSKFDAAKIVWTLFAFVFANDLIRLNVPGVNEIVLPYVRHFIREQETNLWNGIVFYLAGAGLVLSFAPKDIAVMSIVLLSWADTAASTFGRAFGRYTPSVGNRKSVAGCLASALTGLCVSYFFYGVIVPEFPDVNGPGELLWTPETSRLNIHVFALITGLITSFSEAIVIGLLDDNFTIPVLCSLGLSAIAYGAKI